MKKDKILITGVAGFIGFHLAKKLLMEDYEVLGIDNVNDYYDQNLKLDRLKILLKEEYFHFENKDIANKDLVLSIFKNYRPDIVINLAAQAGVRYSIENPDVYIRSNIEGFFNILEGCRFYSVKHLLYASSSSVYGANKKIPFEEDDIVDNPVSLYAASKKSNELMASTYSHLYKIPISGLRFFTVYGPYGRPDMAYFKFTDKYFKNEAIHIFNDGDFENDLYRDFTYIDDVVLGIIKLMHHAPFKNQFENYHEVYNIGNNNPIKLMKFINTLEKSLSLALNNEIEFRKIFEPIKPGDVKKTYASTKKLFNKIGFEPTTSIETGLLEFAKWYVEYYKK